MASKRGELISLLREFCDSRSVRKRFGLARKIIGSFHELSSRERKAILLSFGVDKVEDFARELTMRKPDRMVESALEVLEQAEEADPDELLGLVESAMTPEGRRDLLERGTSALDEEFLPEDSGKEKVESESPPDDPLDELEHEESEEEAEEDELTEIPSGREVLEGEEDLSESTDTNEEARRLVTAPEEGVDPDEVQRALDMLESPLIAELRSMTSIMGRLAHFREHLEETRKLGLEELEKLIHTFPEGWQRRRAAMALLEAGVPESEMDAADLVEDNFESASDRRWLDPLISR